MRLNACSIQKYQNPMRIVEEWDCKSFSLVDVDDTMPISKQWTLIYPKCAVLTTTRTNTTVLADLPQCL